MTPDAACYTVEHKVELHPGNGQGPLIFTGDTLTQAGVGVPRTDCEQQLFDSMKFLMDSSNFSAETLLMPGMEAGDENFKFAR